MGFYANACVVLREKAVIGLFKPGPTFAILEGVGLVRTQILEGSMFKYFILLGPISLLSACGTEESEKVAGLLLSNSPPSTPIVSTSEPTTPDESDTQNPPDEPDDPVVPPVVVAPKLLMHFNAAMANGGGAPYAPGCQPYQGVWANLETPAAAGFLTGFLSTDCGTNSPMGWKGSGLPTDPYRLGFALVYGNRFVKVNNHPSLNPTEGISIVVWFRTTAQMDYENILVKPFTGSSGGNEQYRIGRDDGSGKLIFGLKTSGNMKYAYSAKNWSSFVNKWTMVAATYDGSKMKIYVNGALDETKTASGAINVSTEALGIGGHNLNNYDEFNGDVATVLLYDKPLSASQILENCNSSKPFLSGLACSD